MNKALILVPHQLAMLHIRNLASGSSGNSTLVRSEETAILIDAGLSALQIRKRVEDSGLEIGDIDAILISHEHGDHIKGIDVLSRRYGLKVYANEGTWLGIREKLGKDIENAEILDYEMAFGDIRVESFPVPHDANDPVGFRIEHDGNNATVVTDMGHSTSYLLNALRDSAIIIIESNHDVEMLENGSYPYYLKQRILGPEGHLSNEDCGKVLKQSITDDTVAVMLAHLSEKNNTPELAKSTVMAHIGDDSRIMLTGREAGPEIRL